MLDKRQFYVDGKWIAPQDGIDFEVINPSDEKAFATISLASDTTTNEAVAAANRAFMPWMQTPLEERIGFIKKILQIYEHRFDEVAETISREMGAPIDLARKNQAHLGRFHIKNFLRALEGFEFERSRGPLAPKDKILLEPIGVIGMITPWNWPINQIVLKVIPALATGCTMVLKPSEISPLCAMLFAEMVDEAGLPNGVFNLVNGDGAGVGTQLSGHQDVDMISFTGSTRAGIAIQKNAADTIKRVTLELGGKGANIIFADADDEAVKRGVERCMQNSGQSCNAPTRMLVQRDIYDQSVEIAAATANATKVDHSDKEGPHIGPVVSEAQFNKVQSLIEKGIEEGARLVSGGPGRPNDLNRGYFVRPTVFADVNNQMTIAREEIFGPVLSIIPFETEQEAIEIANDTPYGLTNFVQSTDMDKAHRVTRRLRSGMVEINGHVRGPGAPFGGYKMSGNGREGGAWGIEEFLETKSVGGWY